MNYNPNNFKIGDIVILDEGYRTISEVEIVEIKEKTMSAIIRNFDNDEEWEVKMSRLSPINNPTIII